VVTSLMAGSVELTRSEIGMLGTWSGWVAKIGLDGGNIDIVGRFTRIVKEVENFMLLINGSGNGGWQWDWERRWRWWRRW